MAFVRVPGNPEPDGAEEIWTKRQGLSLRAIVAPALVHPSRGSVLLFSGRTEFIEKYFEAIRELQARGFAVFAMDWRGQGLSDRLLPDRLKGHLESLDDPVDDLAAAVRELDGRLPGPRIVLAHSMGGAIALRALQRQVVQAAGAMFSSPMWGIAHLTPAARAAARLLKAIGLGARFALNERQTWEEVPFEGNPFTRDEERLARTQALVKAEPRLALAGVTWGWLHAATTALDGFRRPGALRRVDVPIIVASAGADTIVDNGSHALVATLLPQARRIDIPDARHELLMERPEARARFWEAFDDLAERIAPRRAATA